MKTIAQAWQAMASRGADLPSALLVGATAEFVATTPITAAMEIMRWRLPWWERYSLPPKPDHDQAQRAN